jgi:ABC-type cobalt transport system substrate-binding protein
LNVEKKVSRLKMTLTILLAVLVVLSMTTVVASAHGDGRWGGSGAGEFILTEAMVLVVYG